MELGLRHMAVPVAPIHLVSLTFSIVPIDARSLKLPDHKSIAPYPLLWLNSGHLGTGPGYGSRLPPESRVAFPVS